MDIFKIDSTTPRSKMSQPATPRYFAIGHFWLVIKVKILRGSRGGAPAKNFRSCKVLSIIFIIETKAKKGGPR